MKDDGDKEQLQRPILEESFRGSRASHPDQTRPLPSGREIRPTHMLVQHNRRGSGSVTLRG